MLKFIVTACLLFCWISTEVCYAAIEPINEIEREGVEQLKQAGVSDAEIGYFLTWQRKFVGADVTPEQRLAAIVSHL